MNSVTYPKYRYNGAKSLIILHEKYLISFYHIWVDAKNLNISLPKTNDKDYLTLETLLKHVLGSSAGYIEWICEKLELPDPKIKEIPQIDIIQKEAENFIAHLIEVWSSQLADVEDSAFHSPTYISNWGVNYCIDAMLEHAVMHPIRHRFQLRKLISDKKSELES